MPLTAGLRDEENERISNILKRLIALDYVPDLGNQTVDDILSEIGLTYEILSNMKSEDLILHLKKCSFDWENAEQFADFLSKISHKIPSFKENAIAVYHYVQTESKTFSFGISNKIARLK